MNRCRRVKPTGQKYTGVIEMFWNQGMEGVAWSFVADGKTGWDAMMLIEAGDWLKVFGEDGAVDFDGVICPDKKVGLTTHPLWPVPHQRALGCHVKWIQYGWKPDDWAKLFIRDERAGEKLLRAELIKKQPSKDA